MLVTQEGINRNLSKLDSAIKTHERFSSERIVEINAFTLDFKSLTLDYRDYTNTCVDSIGMKKMLSEYLVQKYGNIFYIINVKGNILSQGESVDVRVITQQIVKLHELVVKEGYGVYEGSISSRVNKDTEFINVVQLVDDYLENKEYRHYNTEEEFKSDRPDIAEWLDRQPISSISRSLENGDFNLVNLNIKDIIGFEIDEIEELQKGLDEMKKEIMQFYAILAVCKTSQNDKYLKEVVIDGNKYYGLKDSSVYGEILIDYIDTFRLFNELGESSNGKLAE